jgi:hypothetical protein
MSVQLTELIELVVDPDSLNGPTLEGSVDEHNVGFRVPSRVIEGPLLPDRVDVEGMLFEADAQSGQADGLLRKRISAGPGEDVARAGREERSV